MSTIEITSKVASLIEWTSLMEEAAAMVDSLKDEIKAEMNARGVEELEVDTHIIRYTSVLSQRFDSTGFRKAEPEMYLAYVKEVKGHRFTVS